MRQTALVTGGGRGIGLGIACALAREGLDIAFCGMRDPQAVRHAVAALEQLGAAAYYVQCNIGSKKERGRMMDALKTRFQRLHVLVNNAGMAPRERRDILEASEDCFEEVLRVNLQGPYFLTQAVAGWMLEERKKDPAFRGCIINIGSISSTMASIHRGEYCMSKAGLSMATKLWAVRLAEYHIPVYEIRPGMTQTDMTAEKKTHYDRRIAEGLTLQARWGTPEDIGRAAAMLVRGDLPYSTGQVLMVDGGLTVERF